MIGTALALLIGIAVAASSEEHDLAPLSTETKLDVVTVRELALSIVEVGQPSPDDPNRVPVKVRATNVSADEWPSLGFACFAKDDRFEYSIGGDHRRRIDAGEDVMIEAELRATNRARQDAFINATSEDEMLRALSAPAPAHEHVPNRFECSLQFPDAPDEVARLWKYEREIFIEGCDEQLEPAWTWYLWLGEGTMIRDSEIFVPEDEWRDMLFVNKEATAEALFECAFRRSFAFRALKSGKLLATYSKRTGLSVE